MFGLDAGGQVALVQLAQVNGALAIVIALQPASHGE
jgi:hypothetical protein